MALAHSPSIVRSGLVLHLDAANRKSYPGSGTIWADLSGQSNNGTLTNGPTFNSSNGGSIVFDGSNDYWVSTTSNVFDTQTLTLESWVYPTTLSQDGFLFEKGAVNTQYSHFFNGNGVFYFRTKGLSSEDLTFAASNFCTANRWNHIVSTCGGGIKRTYVNTIIAASVTGLTGTIPIGQTNQYVGMYGPGTGYPLNGRISITRVYNRALTAAEVRQNFEAHRDRYGI